jgi:uncharacterized protein
MAEFEIKVTELDAGGKHYVFPIRASWLASELEALGEAREGLSAPDEDGELSFFADKTGPDVIVRGRVKGGIVAECSRCLGRAPIDVDSELAMLLTARGRTARGQDVRPDSGEDEMSPDELDMETFTGDTIVLDGAVREQILLEVPMQPLCRPDCPGIAVPESVKGPADLSAEAAPKLGVLAEALQRAGVKDDPPAANGKHPKNKVKRAR